MRAKTINKKRRYTRKERKFERIIKKRIAEEIDRLCISEELWHDTCQYLARWADVILPNNKVANVTQEEVDLLIQRIFLAVLTSMEHFTMDDFITQSRGELLEVFRQIGAM